MNPSFWSVKFTVPVRRAANGFPAVNAAAPPSTLEPALREKSFLSRRSRSLSSSRRCCSSRALSSLSTRSSRSRSVRGSRPLSLPGKTLAPSPPRYCPSLRGPYGSRRSSARLSRSISLSSPSLSKPTRGRAYPVPGWTVLTPERGAPRGEPGRTRSYRRSKLPLRPRSRTSRRSRLLSRPCLSYSLRPALSKLTLLALPPRRRPSSRLSLDRDQDLDLDRLRLELQSRRSLSLRSPPLFRPRLSLDLDLDRSLSLDLSRSLDLSLSRFLSRLQLRPRDTCCGTGTGCTTTRGGGGGGAFAAAEATTRSAIVIASSRISARPAARPSA